VQARPLRALLLLCLAFLSLAAARPGDDEIVQEFRKYFRKFKDTPTRIEAVLALEGTESVGVVDALTPVLADSEPEVVRAAVRVLSGFKTPEPVAAIYVRLEEEKKDSIRAGLLRAIAGGNYKGPPEALLSCLEDRDWDVRRRAIQALCASGGEGTPAAILPLCEDKEPAVRCAAIEGLAGLDSELVLDPAIAALEDDVWQVRASAALALGKVRAKRSIEPLISRMEREEGRLLADYANALEELTGRAFGQRVELWREFWERNKDRYEIPSDEQLAKLKEKKAEAEARYNPPGAVTYHGIDTPSRRIVFVIDVSGSMENEVIEKERFEDGGYPSFQRIDIVKTELARTIEGLESYVEFNILAFATEVDPWKKKLVRANVLNKRSALDWVERLEALGGTSKEDLARVGLVGAANLEAGKTNTFGALMSALEAKADDGPDEEYEVELDTIFFLSDGRPTVGDLVDPDDILREVKRANDLRKVVIHTIALGEFQKEFMRRLAVENGGVFVDLGR
jgi:HEAT repeat protein